MVGCGELPILNVLILKSYIKIYLISMFTCLQIIFSFDNSTVESLPIFYYHLFSELSYFIYNIRLQFLLYIGMKSRIKYLSNIQISNRLVPKDPDSLSSTTKQAPKSQIINISSKKQPISSVDPSMPINRQKCYSVKEVKTKTIPNPVYFVNDRGCSAEDEKSSKSQLQVDQIYKVASYNVKGVRQLQVNQHSTSEFLLQQKGGSNDAYQNSLSQKFVNKYKKTEGHHQQPKKTEIDEILVYKQKLGEIGKREEYRMLMKNYQYNKTHKNIMKAPFFKETSFQCQTPHKMSTEKKPRIRNARQSEPHAPKKEPQQCQSFLKERIHEVQIRISALQKQLALKDQQLQKVHQEKAVLDNILKQNKTKTAYLQEALRMKNLELDKQKLQSQQYLALVTAKQEHIQELHQQNSFLIDKLESCEVELENVSLDYGQIMEIFGIEYEGQEDPHDNLISSIKSFIDHFTTLASSVKKLESEVIENMDKNQRLLEQKQGMIKDLRYWKSMNQRYPDQRSIKQLEQTKMQLQDIISLQIERSRKLEDVVSGLSEKLMIEQLHRLDHKYSTESEIWASPSTKDKRQSVIQ